MAVLGSLALPARGRDGSSAGTSAMASAMTSAMAAATALQPPSSSTEPAGLAQGSKALNCRLGSRMCQGSRAKAPGIECRSLLARQRRAAPHRNPSPFNGDGPVATVLGQNALTQRILGVGGAATPRLQRRCRRSASQGQHASPAHDRVSRLLPVRVALSPLNGDWLALFRGYSPPQSSLHVKQNHAPY